METPLEAIKTESPHLLQANRLSSVVGKQAEAALVYFLKMVSLVTMTEFLSEETLTSTREKKRVEPL